MKWVVLLFLAFLVSPALGVAAGEDDFDPLRGVEICSPLLTGEKLVLVLGSKDDALDHSRYVIARLKELGVSALLVDTAKFPKKLGITFNPVENQWQLELANGRKILPQDVHSIYWRSVSTPFTHNLAISQRDSKSLLESFLMRFPGRWVNSREAVDLHQTKPVQLAMVSDLGIRTPKTLFTNSTQEALAFLEAVPDAVYKSVQGGVDTVPVTKSLRKKIRKGGLDFAPATFQERIPGADIRVFVFGNTIEAIEILAATTDFRADPRAKFQRMQLPAEIRRHVQRIRKTLKLEFSGMDFKRTADGEYVFLEANPSPMFIGFEEATGIPLTRHLLKLLVEENNKKKKE